MLSPSSRVIFYVLSHLETPIAHSVFHFLPFFDMFSHSCSWRGTFFKVVFVVVGVVFRRKRLICFIKNDPLIHLLETASLL